MNEMKKNRKNWLIGLNLLAIFSIFALTIAQLSIGITGIFAKEEVLSLTLKDETSELNANVPFIITISDLRSESAISTTVNSSIPYSDLSQDIVDSSYSSGDQVQRVWSIVLPEGVTFDQELEKSMLEEEEKDSPTFQYDESNRTLTITAPVTMTELDVLLTATVAKDYSLKVEDPNLSGSESQSLTFTVGESIEDSSTDELNEGTNSSASSQLAAQSRADLGTNVVSITDWDGFVQALGDSTITGIVLENDISLSGTLVDNYNVFSTSSVDLDSEDYSYLYLNKRGIGRTIVIDGGGFTFDFNTLAIGMLPESIYSGSSGTTIGNYWNITLQNMNVNTTNPSGSFFKTSYSSQNNTSQGLTQAQAQNTTITYDSSVNHTRKFKDYIGFLASFGDISVQKAEAIDDMIIPTGTVSFSYYLWDNARNASRTIMNVTSQNNQPGGNLLHNYFNIAADREFYVEGNGYTFDYGQISAEFYNGYGTTSSQSGWDVTLANMNVYHGNYWGSILFRSNTSGTLRLVNYTDTGDQMMESQTMSLVMSGNIRMEHKQYYTSYRKNGDLIRQDWQIYSNTQCMISVLNATISADANVELISKGTNPIYIDNGGYFEVQENANVQITRGEESWSGQGEHLNATIGISGTGKFLAKSGSHITIDNHHSSIASCVYLASSSSSFIIEQGAQMDVNIDGYTGTTTSTAYSYIPIYMGGGTITIGGALYTNFTNNTNNPTNVIHANSAATFTVESNGVLDIKSDSAHYQQNLIYMGGSSSTSVFEFSDALRVNLERTVPITTGTNNNNSGLIRSGGTLNVSVQNVFQWNYGNISSGTDTGYNFDYQPMSNMILTYSNAVPTKTSYNSMTSTIAQNFGQNFTTQTQRVLFTRIPDPNITINSIANDNPVDPSNGSTIIAGWATPGTYVRLWDTSDYISDADLAKLKGTNDTVASPVDDLTTKQDFRDPFTVQADTITGEWSYTLTGNQLTAESVIHAYGFYNLKEEEVTQTVLDKTAPTGESVTYTSYVGNSLPDPSVFVTNVDDTNPLTQTFTYEYVDQAAVEALLQTENTTGTTVQIYVGDNAGNKAIIEGTLIVYQNASGISADSPLELSYVDIRDMNDTQLSTYILQESHPTAYKIVDGSKTEWTDASQFSVTDLGGLSGLSGITPNTNYPVTITLPSSISGLDTDLTTTIQVTIINMNAVLTIEFVNEGGAVLSGYTLTAGEESSNSIVTDLYVGDTVDLTGTTSTTYQKVQDQLAALQTAGYEITTRPADEANFVITGTTQTVQYGVTGQLYLQSAPDEVEFGSITFNAKTQRVDNPTPDKDLVVTDTRADKTNGWTLYASLTSEMKNTVTGSIMSEALRYVKDGGQELTLNSGNQAVYTTTDGGSYDVTGDWGITATDPGLKLVADPNKTTVSSKGSYSGVITWTIMAGQP